MLKSIACGAEAQQAIRAGGCAARGGAEAEAHGGCGKTHRRGAEAAAGAV